MLYHFNEAYAGEEIKIIEGVNLSYQAHLHDSFEVIYITRGRSTVTVDNTRYELETGDGLLVFPHQLHEFKSDGESAHFIAIFSPKLVNAYSAVYTKKLPRSARIPKDYDVRASLLGIKGKEGDVLFVKGVLYSMLALFNSAADYLPRKSENENLILKIFKFVEESYKGDASLTALAKETGYSYVYLSRYFTERTGASYADYVNEYRISIAKKLVKDTDASILNIALETGFGSLRSFNRRFKEKVGATPSEWRAQSTQ